MYSRFWLDSWNSLGRADILVNDLLVLENVTYIDNRIAVNMPCPNRTLPQIPSWDYSYGETSKGRNADAV